MLDAWGFWDEELRGFPAGGGEAALWVARRSGPGGGLELLVTRAWTGARALERAPAGAAASPVAAGDPAPGAPPLGRLLRAMRDGLATLSPVAVARQPGGSAWPRRGTEATGRPEPARRHATRAGAREGAGRGAASASRTSGGAGPAVCRLLWVEPVGGARDGGSPGALALQFDDLPPWGEAIRLWGRRLASRLAHLLPDLPVCPAAGPAASRQASLFPSLPVAGPGPVGLPLPRPVFLPGLPGAVGISRELAACCAELPGFARSGVNVLLHGETGTGKEIVAQAIHRLSPRHERPFIGLNCAALPEGLFESELFGHRAGSFTGAATDKMGLLEAADGGTFFLDEIGDMPLALQIKLLRVMQERRVRRVGELESRPVDLRFVAATHRDLPAEIAAGRFRQDLFYRLNVVGLRIPPLRQRPEDVAHLLAYFLQRHGDGARSPRIEEQALAALQGYRWPGNVRELENEARRLLALQPGAPLIRLEMLSAEVRRASGRSIDPADLATLRGLDEATELLERYLIRKAIAAADGRKAAAARRLGLSRQGLYKKIQRYGMSDLVASPPAAAPGAEEAPAADATLAG